MFGPPKDVEGKCNARFFLADDYGDNHCTLLCRLEPSHSGPHKEEFSRTYQAAERKIGSEIVITWQEDERLYHEMEDDN